MKELKLFALLVFIFTTHSLKKNANKIHATKVQTSEIDQEGFDLGEQILDEFDHERTLYNIFQNIQRTQRMQEIAYDYAKELLKNPKKLEDHPQFNSRAKKFTSKSVYSEFAAILIAKENFAHRALQLWKKKENNLNDIKKEYDECGAYCAIYGNGYLCTAVFINLAEQEQSK